MQHRCFRTPTVLIVIGCAICLLGPATSALAKNDTAGIPAVLAKLEEIEKKLEQNATELDTLKTQVATLDANTTPCTLQRFRDGLCGPDNHPLDITVSICGSLGADGSFTTKYAMSGTMEVQAGVGWKDAPDVHLVENFQAPPGIPILLPTIPPIPAGWIMLPNEVAANLQAAAALGLDACIDDIRLPVGKSISEPVVIALLEKLEQAAQPVLTTLASQLGADQNANLVSTRSAIQDVGMNLEALNTALTKVKELAQADFNSDNPDPLNAFKSGPLRGLADNLPVGARLQAILDDPGQMAIPALQESGASQTIVTASAGGSLNYNGMAGRLCASLSAPESSLQNLAGPVCNFVDQVGTAMPSLEDVLVLIANINLVPDVPAAVKAVLQPLFDNAGAVVADAGNSFCSSRVGSRPLFDALCGR